jgi:hypothetical protein
MAEKLVFYDVKSKKKVASTAWKVVNRGGRRFAVAKAPAGHQMWRVLGKK